MIFKEIGSALLLVMGLSAQAQFNPDYEHTVNSFGILPHEHNEKNCKNHKFCDHADSTHTHHAEHLHMHKVERTNAQDTDFTDTVKFDFNGLKPDEVSEKRKHQKPSLEN